VDDLKFKLIAAACAVALSTPASAALLDFTTTGISVGGGAEYVGSVFGI
jgi:hypothetical protein